MNVLRFIWLCVFCAFAQASLAQEASLREIVSKFAPSGVQSIVVADARTGNVIEQIKGDTSVTPASVAKIMTTVYGLKSLGSHWQFKTRVMSQSSVVNDGILQGDLVLMGGGDPLLDTDGLARLVDQLVSRGITGISGDFLINDKALPFQQGLDRDQPVYVSYNPTISGLNLNFNRVFFEWKKSGSGYDITLSAKTENYKPVVNGITVTPVQRSKPVYGHSIAGEEKWTVSAAALKNKGNRFLPVKRPAQFAGEVFRSVAQSKGLTLPRGRLNGGEFSGAILAEEKSARLMKLSGAMLKFSNNLTAEAVGLSTSIKRGARPRRVSDSAREMTTWLRGRYGLTSLRQVDHSGLGKASKVSARDVTRILSKEGWNGPLRRLLKSVDLRNSEWKKAPLEGTTIVAKTGTLNFTSALAGYIDAKSGRKLTFAILTQDEALIRAIPRDKRDAAPGSQAWARKSRIMQHQLLRHWAESL